MAAGTVSPGNDFHRLLETERQLEARLRAARLEGEVLIASAKQAAASRLTALAAELEAEEQRLRSDLEAERQSREAEITAAAQRDVGKYEGLSRDQIAAIAGSLASRLFGEDSS